MDINIIAAIGKNNELGKNNDLIWKFKQDMKFFKDTTMGHPIVMGRKTWDSLPKKPLPNRFNIIVTSQEREDNDIDVKHSSMEEVKAFLELDLGIPVFIIGGGMIYRELLPYCQEVYLTRILKDHDNVDTYFPNLDEMEEWEQDECSETYDYNGVNYQYQHYRRH